MSQKSGDEGDQVKGKPQHKNVLSHEIRKLNTTDDPGP